MSREHWMRGGQDGREREFDWYGLARERGIPFREAQRLYDAAQQLLGSEGAKPVRALFEALLEQARPAEGQTVPGKVTRAMRSQRGDAQRRGAGARRAPAGAKRSPGRSTLVSYLMRDGGRASEGTGEMATRAREQVLAWLRAGTSATELNAEISPAESAPDAAPEPALEVRYDPERMPLPSDVRARMERSFGYDFSDIEVVVDSERVSGSTHALTEGRELHFGRDRFQPGTGEGDWLIAHELAHVAQSRTATGTGRTASRGALESEADTLASLAARGASASPSLHAPSGMALAYSDARTREEEEEEEEERARRLREGGLTVGIALEAGAAGISLGAGGAMGGSAAAAIEAAGTALRESPMSALTHVRTLGAEALRAAEAASAHAQRQSPPGAEAAAAAQQAMNSLAQGVPLALDPAQAGLLAGADVAAQAAAAAELAAGGAGVAGLAGALGGAAGLSGALAGVEGLAGALEGAAGEAGAEGAQEGAEGAEAAAGEEGAAESAAAEGAGGEAAAAGGAAGEAGAEGEAGAAGAAGAEGAAGGGGDLAGAGAVLGGALAGALPGAASGSMAAAMVGAIGGGLSASSALGGGSASAGSAAAAGAGASARVGAAAAGAEAGASASPGASAGARAGASAGAGAGAASRQAPAPVSSAPRQAPLASVPSAPNQEVDRNAETVVQPDVPLSHQSAGRGSLPSVEASTPEAAAASAGVDYQRQSDVAGAIESDPQVSGQRQAVDQAVADFDQAGQAPAPAPAPATSSGATPASPSATRTLAEGRAESANAARSLAAPELPTTPESAHLPDAPAGPPAASPATVATPAAPTLPEIANPGVAEATLPEAPTPPQRSVTAATEQPTVPAPQPAPVNAPGGDSVPDPASLADRSIDASADRAAHQSALAAESATSSVVPEEESAARASQIEPLPPAAQETYTATVEPPHAQIQAGQQAGAQQVSTQASSGCAEQAQAAASNAAARAQEAVTNAALGPSQPPPPAIAHRETVASAASEAASAASEAVNSPAAPGFTPPGDTAAEIASVQSYAPPSAGEPPVMAEPAALEAPPLPEAAEAPGAAEAASMRAQLESAPLPPVSLQAPVSAGGGDRRSQALAEVEVALQAEANAQIGPAMEAAAAPARQQLAGELSRAEEEAQAHVSEVQAQAQAQQASIQAESPPVQQADLDAQSQAHWAEYEAQSEAAQTQAQSEVSAAETEAQQQATQAEQSYQQSLSDAQAQQQSEVSAAQASYDSAAAEAQAQCETSQQAAQTQLESDQSAAEAQAQQAQAQAEADAQAQVTQAEAQHQSEVAASEQQFATERQTIETENQAELQRLQAESEAQSTQARADMDGEVARLEAEGQAQSEQHLSEGEQAYRSELDRGQAEAEQERSRAESEAAAKEAEAEEERSRGRSLLQRGLDWVGSVVGDLLEAAAGILRAARDAVVGIMERARTAALDALNSFRELAQQALQVAMDAIQSAIAAAAETIRSIIEAAAEAIQSAIRAAAEALQSVVQALTDAINGLIEVFQSLVNAALDGLIAAVGMINQEWGQALADASSGFRESFNAAVDQLQSDIQSASDTLQEGIGQAAEAMCATVEAAAQTMQDAVTAVENTLHAAVAAAGETLSQVIDAAFDMAESAVNAAFDAAEAVVTAWFDAQIAALELAAVVVEEAMALAGELVALAIEAITAPFEMLVDLLPDALIEGFIDFWNGPWREMVVIGLISLAAVAITVATCGAGAPLGALILTGALAGGAMGGAAYFGGEMVARQGATELQERNEDGHIYVPGQGYVDPATLIDPATGQVRADLPPEVAWAASNFHIGADGSVEAKNNQELFDYAASEGIEGAVVGGISGAAAVAGGAIGGRAANALLGRGAGTVTRAMASAGVEGVFDVAGGALSAGSVNFIEALESGASLGEAATGALQTLNDQLLSPQAVLTGMFSVGFAGGGARFVDGRFTGQASEAFANVGWDTVSGVFSEAGGGFTGTLVQDLSNGVPLDQALANAQAVGGDAFDPRKVLFGMATSTLGSQFDMDLTPETPAPGSSATTRVTPDGSTPANTNAAPDTGSSSVSSSDSDAPSTTPNSPPPPPPPSGGAVTAPRPSGDAPTTTANTTTPRPSGDAPTTANTTPANTTPRPVDTTPANTTTPRPSGDAPTTTNTTPRPVDTAPANTTPANTTPRPADTTPANSNATPRTDTDGANTTPRLDVDADTGAVAAGLPSPTDGISDGRVTRDDFLGTEATDAEVARVRADSENEAAMSLDEQAASITTGTSRSERDLLIAAQNGDVPRFLARVGPQDNFTSHNTFANPNRPFGFAAEPADLRGISPAEAMYKVGWTREWIEPNIGKEIVIAVLDTNVGVAAPDGSTNQIATGRMEWAELSATAVADSNFTDAAEARGIRPEDLPALFAILEQTPVQGTPRSSDPAMVDQAQIVRGLIDRIYGANNLYTGVGVTMREDGQIGGREVMMQPNGTGLALTPDNHRLVNLGVMTQAQFDALFAPGGTGATPTGLDVTVPSTSTTTPTTTSSTTSADARPRLPEVTPDPSVIDPAGPTQTPEQTPTQTPANEQSAAPQVESAPAPSAGAGDPVLASEPILLTGDDARLAEAARRIQPEPGRLDVIVHGTADTFVVVQGGRQIQLDHRSLARFIQNSGGAGQNIRLISCGTGGTSASVAQHLANKLGVNVMAPSATAWIHPDGRVTIGRSPTDDSGAWNSFDPGNRFQEGTPGNANQQPAADADASSADSGNSVDTADGVNADTGPPGGLEPAPDGPAVAAGVASPEATAAARELAGGAAAQNVKKFVFDASESDAVKQRVRERAQDAAEQAYDAAIVAGKTPKQARKDANKAATQAARAEAEAEAQRAAQAMAQQAIANGGAFDMSTLDPNAQSQLSSFQSSTGFEAQRIASAVAGMNDANFQNFMAAEVSSGNVAAPSTANIPAPNPPPTTQTMEIWEYADGTVVRYKPLGDSERPNPTYSVEVKSDPTQPDSSANVAFKVGDSGEAVPKGPFSVANPFSRAGDTTQYDAFLEFIMNAGHKNL
ncbi:eCIS core domain-containing protein [Haliangium ochraceum]|uniref:eCIS core domain-containing protein n=1 Tax=Haliangium ochraceum (strain DSM 14365 / JCM 11303 / SMP-2) TaxID=502025 RepID=D0LHV4_HALO1|nr:DUF4157 domain-containing protein [Haliangium ochraceum]ACY14783.1 conserved hypothetical protein [Haliangium ochraceum DSM 14365]